MSNPPIKLEPIGRMDLFRRVLDQLIAYIDENGLQPGDRLPSDRDLVAALQVSRPVVQQALKVLEGLGRVVIVHGSGTFVADNGLLVAANELVRGLENADDFRENLLRTRQIVDEDVMRTAWREQPEALLEGLAAVLEARRIEVETDDEAEEASLDLRFEAAFAHFCSNPVLNRLQATLHHAWLQMQINETASLADRHLLDDEHRKMYELLRSGDIEGVISLFGEHIRHLRS